MFLILLGSSQVVADRELGHHNRKEQGTVPVHHRPCYPDHHGERRDSIGP